MKLKHIKKTLTLSLALVMTTVSCIIVTAASKYVTLTDNAYAFYESSYSNYTASASTTIYPPNDYNVARVQVSATAYAIDSSTGAKYAFDSKSDSDDLIAEVDFSSSSNMICDITSYHYSYIALTNGFGYSNSDYLP